MLGQLLWYLSGDMAIAQAISRRSCWCHADVFLNVTNYKMQRLGILITEKVGHVSLVRCTYDWHNCRSSRKLILCIPPAITHANVTEDLMTITFRKEHLFKIEAYLKWGICQRELDTLDTISIV
jgi:hypothetical protein